MLQESTARPIRVPCGWAGCPDLGIRAVTTYSPIGRRVEVLCASHSARRAQLEPVVRDVAFTLADEPRFVLTDKGRAAIASAA